MKIPAREIFKVLAITAAFVGLLLVVYTTKRELIWLGTAFFLAIALNPAVAKLSGFMPRKNRLLGATSVFLIVLFLLGFLVFALVPPLIGQSQQLAGSLPKYTDQIVNGHSFLSDQIRNLHLVDKVRTSQDQIVQYASSASGSFYSILKSVFSSFAAGLTIFVLTFFMLLEGPGWIATFWKMFPKDKRVHGRKLVDQMYAAVTGYVTGNLLTSLIAATLVAIALAVIGVPYAIPLGLFVGLFDLLPLVGATIGAVVVVIVSLFTSLTAAIVMVIFFLIYQQVENHVLQPLVYGKTVQMSPLLVLVSILIGVGLAGFIGAIVAIPVGASIQILLRDLTLERMAK